MNAHRYIPSFKTKTIVYFTSEFTFHIASITSALGQTVNQRNASYLSKRFIVHSLGYFQTISNTWLVSPSMEEASYASNKLHEKNGWHRQTYTTSQSNDNPKAYHVASTWEGVFPLRLKGDLAALPLSPADFSMKCFHFAPFGFSCLTGYN